MNSRRHSDRRFPRLLTGDSPPLSGSGQLPSGLPGLDSLIGGGLDVGDVRACLDAGFDSHVAKPVDWPRLAGIISQLTARSTAPDTNAESLRA